MPKPPELSRDEFVRQAVLMFGQARVKRQAHTIKRCECGSDNCGGWSFDPGAEDDPLFVFNPPVIEV
jgi:hypothetical protein